MEAIRSNARIRSAGGPTNALGPLMLRFGRGDLFPGLHTYEVHTVPRVAQGESLQNLKHGVPVTKRWQGRMTYEVGPPPENRISNCIVIRQQGKNPPKLL